MNRDVFGLFTLIVHEDLRINLVEEMLPNTNCGACGLPECRAFAEALVQQKVLPVQCTVSTDEAKFSIAAEAAASGHINISQRPLIFIEPEGEHAAAVTAGLSMTGLRSANFFFRSGYRLYAVVVCSVLPSIPTPWRGEKRNIHRGSASKYSSGHCRQNNGRSYAINQR